MLDRNKNLFANTHWGVFSVTEGIFRVFNLGILKTIAAFMVSPVLGFVAVGIIGLVRLVGSGLLTFRSGFEFYPSKQAVLGSMLTGVMTAYITLVPLYVFFAADAPLTVFVVALMAGFVPIALISKYKARGRLSILQIVGLILTIIGLWALTGFATSNLFTETPLWMWTIITLPVFYLIRDLVERTTGTSGVISPWVHNIWLGLSMVVFSVVGVFGFNAAIFTEGLFLNNLSSYAWLIIISGIFYIVVTFARQKSFSVMGGVFARKKLLMISSMIITSLVIDLMFFGNIPGGLIVESIILVFVGYSIVEGLLLKGK